MKSRATVLRAFAIALALAGAACGDGPTGPGASPTIQCPADLQVNSADGRAVAVNYTLPPASGGKPPISVVCSPASGVQLLPGTHTINCTATDSEGRNAQCSFRATVVGPPVLTDTRFIAFGDSLTWGVTSTPVSGTLMDLFRMTAVEPPPPTSYPNQLQLMLRARYVLQTPVVYNEGVGGEKVDGEPTNSPSGLLRLPQVLNSHPDAGVLLLMEGTNDLLVRDTGPPRALAGLKQMIGMGKQAGVKVFLATIPPQRAGGARHRDRVAALIPGFNDQIRALAASEQIPLVDVYEALKDKMHLIGVDDLHPTVEGYVLIAQTFFEKIKSELESTQSTQPPALTPGGPTALGPGRAGPPANRPGTIQPHSKPAPDPATRGGGRPRTVPR